MKPKVLNITIDVPEKVKVDCLGIDPSSVKLAFVWEEDGALRMKTMALPSEALWVARCAVAFQLVGKFLDEYDVRSVYVEAPVMGAGGPGATIPQALVTGSILAACGEYGVPFSKLVNNQSWKKKVMGRGNINKEEIALEMKTVWPKASRMAKGDQDLIDAAGIYKFGVAYNKLRRKFIRAGKVV